MEFARVLRELWSRPRLLALGAVIAVIAAVISVYRFDGGTLKARSLPYSSATTQVLVDSSTSLLGSVSPASEPLAIRAQIYANFMTSPAFLEVVGKQVSLSGAQLYAAGPINTNQLRAEKEPTDLKRNVQITGETKPYRLGFETQSTQPTITIDAQAPTTALAVALANASATGLEQYVGSVQSTEGIPPRSRLVIRQLGPASGGVVDGRVGKELALLVFVAVFLLWCLMVIVVRRFRENWRASAALQAEFDGARGGADAERPTPDEVALRDTHRYDVERARLNGGDHADPVPAQPLP
jgi:hypothetical protein